MRVRFPYPPTTTVALVLVAAFAIGHTVYTSREVAALTSEVGPTADARNFVLAMYAMSLVLTAFVAVMLLHRSRLELEFGDSHLTLRRLHLVATSRERAVAWDDLRRVVVRPDPRGNWHLLVELDERTRKYPLSHARIERNEPDLVPDGTAPGAPSPSRTASGWSKVQRVRSRDDARSHPVVAWLHEKLGDRCVVRG